MNILMSTGMPFPTKFGSFERWLVEVGSLAHRNGHCVYISYSQRIGGVEVYSKAVDEAGCVLVVLENDQQIEAFCRDKCVDIAHFHFDIFDHNGLYASLHKRGVRLFATVHCECGYFVKRDWQKSLTSFVRIWGHRLKTHFRIGYFERIFPCSMTIKRQYERFYFWPKEKLQCLYLGIPKPRQSQPKTPNAIPVISCTAFHSPIKGVDVLLNALKILKDRQLRFRCFQIGGGSSELDGQDTAQLKELCTSLGLDDVVTWVGITNHVDHYLHQTDIYCQPSRTEAICLSIAEAMACEIPVVASNVGGIPELVKDGTTGFLVEPDAPVALADKLELLIRDEVQRTSMGQKSKERIDEIAFYQKKSAEKLMGIYEQS